MIPLLLSLTFASGVLLTFEGLARPREHVLGPLRWQGAQEFLVRAGLRGVTARDFLIFSIASGGLAAVMAQLFLGWGVISGLAGGLGLLAPYAYYVRRHDRRRAAIQDALVEAIEQLRDGIRTGLSVHEALVDWRAPGQTRCAPNSPVSAATRACWASRVGSAPCAIGWPIRSSTWSRARC